MNPTIVFRTKEEKLVYERFAKYATTATRVGFISDVQFISMLLDLYENKLRFDEAMKRIENKIATNPGSWSGVDVDQFMNEIRGNE